jgi:hypothetical protein
LLFLFTKQKLNLYGPEELHSIMTLNSTLSELNTDLISHPDLSHKNILECATPAMSFLQNTFWNELQMSQVSANFLFDFAYRLLELFSEFSNNLVVVLLSCYSFQQSTIASFAQKSLLCSISISSFLSLTRVLMNSHYIKKKQLSNCNLKLFGCGFFILLFISTI